MHPCRTTWRALPSLVLLAAGAIAPTHADDAVTPWKRDAAYGSDPRQVLDLYLPKGEGPFPLAVFIHGGGWGSGDKVEKLNRGQRDALLDAGIAVASINYRFIADGRRDGLVPPVMAPLQDARRAVQFLRYRAPQWHLDPERVVLFGGSAGACTSLWLALSPEMADPASTDPVERMSTRVSAVGGYGAQTSLDPVQMRAWVGDGLTYGGHAFGCRDFTTFLQQRDKLAPVIATTSPAALVSADDPPIFLTYGQELDEAGRPGKGDYTHSAGFGVGFQQLARERGATCFLQYPGHPPEGEVTNLFAFLIAACRAPVH